MKILLLSHSPDNPDGGASRVFHLLAAGLRERGHEITLVHQESLGLPGRPTLKKAAERLVMPQLLSRAGKSLHPESFDVIIAASGMAAPLFRQLRKEAKRPLLVNLIHGMTKFDLAAYRTEGELGHWPISASYRYVSGPLQVRWDSNGIREADRTVVYNLRDLSEARAMAADDDRVVMIPPSVYPELLEASDTIVDVASRAAGGLLWFGTWEARKGISHVPATLRAARQVRPDITLTLGGTGWREEDLLALFAPEDRSAVTVLPRVSVAEQVRHFNESSIFLFPSLSEGFGLALLEALAFGLAAVTTSTGFGGDFLHDDVNARVVHPSSAHLSRAIIDLVESDDRRTTIALRGRETARSFTLQKMIDDFEALLGDAISS